MDCRAKKAALFFLACEANPAMRLSLPAAMRAKGYSDVEATDRILVQQVRRESQKKAPKEHSPQVCGRILATGGLDDCGNDSEAGALIGIDETDGCSRHRGGWD